MMEVPIPRDDPMDFEDPDSPLVRIEVYRKPNGPAPRRRKLAQITTGGPKAKTACAVFSVSIPETSHAAIYEYMHPNSLGWNIQITPPVTRDGRTSWLTLIANAKSAQQSDIENEVIARFNYDIATIHVEKVLGVGYIGASEHRGSSHSSPPTRRGKRGQIMNVRPPQ